MTRTKSDDAVSPVIGVMLMLVVTVVIAGVVTIFATGLMTDTEPAPVSKFDVEIYSAYEIHSSTIPNMHITLVSGDSIDTADLKFTFSWECPHGDSCPFKTGGHHSSSYEYTGEDRWGTYGSPAGDSPFGLGMYGQGGVYSPADYSGNTIEPLYLNYGKAGGKFFGTHIWNRGETFVAYELHLKSGVEHADNPAMDALLNNGKVAATYGKTGGVSCPYCGSTNIDGYYCCEDCWECLPCPYCGLIGSIGFYQDYYCDSDDPDWPGLGCGKKVPHGSTYAFSGGIMQCLPQGTAVDVMITHIPSNKLVYDGTVFVE